MMNAASTRTPDLTRAPTGPAQVLSTRFAASPELLWARLVHSSFVADYLGAALPPVLLQAGCRIDGVDQQGQALRLTVVEALAPCSLSLRLQGTTGDRALHLSIEANAQGSRLTVLHDDGALPVAAAGDAIGRLLAAPPAAVLMAARIGSQAALDLARDYLAGSAQAMRLLLAAMTPDQGYAQPAPDRFSLAAQVWHLADVEEFGWAQRLPRVLAESTPVLPGVDGDRLAIVRRYQQRPWRAAARRFITQRRRSLAALARFDAATLARPLVFSAQPGDAGTLLAAMLAHDHEHRLEMAALWQQESRG